MNLIDERGAKVLANGCDSSAEPNVPAVGGFCGARQCGIHTAGGLGARFNFIRRDRVNLRFDYAFGKDSGFYFAIGEAF